MQDLISKVREFAEQNDLLSSPLIVAGLSGGPDSVFLLYFLKNVYKGRLIACHVNHKLRPGAAEADENLRVMQQKYDNQLCTMTDLLDAQSQWQQAHSNLIEAQTQLKIYETEYLRVTGRLE